MNAARSSVTTDQDVREAIERNDATTVPTIRQLWDASGLEPIAADWKLDTSPEARAAQLEYLAQPMNTPGQQTVVKQLFKQAEDNDDIEMLAHCLVAFDRAVRHKRVRTARWDSELRTFVPIKQLMLPHLIVPTTVSGQSRPFWERKSRPHGAIFRHRTRYYLRRRAWRYFRHMGFKQPERYVEAVSEALRLYHDNDLQHGESILESWGLMHICFGKSPAIRKSVSHIVLKDGYTMADLKPAPYFEALWQSREAARVLFQLADIAASHLVRKWAWSMLNSHHADWLMTLEPTRLVPLFSHVDDDVVAAAIDAFRRSSRLDELSIEQWLELLDVGNPMVVDIVCEIIGEHVDPNAISTGDCISLLVRSPTSVSSLALQWLDRRQIDPVADRDLLRTATQAECVSMGAEIADWVLAHAGTSKQYDRDVCSDLLDSRNPAIRRESWNWLAEETSPGQADPALWARLVETPYDDLRLPLIDLLSRRSERAIQTGLGADKLTAVWTGVLANVARGSRQKLRAIDQLRDAIAAQPQRAAELLPVLRIAVRSIRGPEHAHALAAVVELETRRPELAGEIEAAIPELTMS